MISMGMVSQVKRKQNLLLALTLTVLITGSIFAFSIQEAYSAKNFNSSKSNTSTAISQVRADLLDLKSNFGVYLEGNNVESYIDIMVMELDEVQTGLDEMDEFFFVMNVELESLKQQSEATAVEPTAEFATPEPIADSARNFNSQKTNTSTAISQVRADLLDLKSNFGVYFDGNNVESYIDNTMMLLVEAEKGVKEMDEFFFVMNVELESLKQQSEATAVEPTAEFATPEPIASSAKNFNSSKSNTSTAISQLRADLLDLKSNFGVYLEGNNVESYIDNMVMELDEVQTGLDEISEFFFVMNVELTSSQENPEFATPEPIADLSTYQQTKNYVTINSISVVKDGLNNLMSDPRISEDPNMTSDINNMVVQLGEAQDGVNEMAEIFFVISAELESLKLADPIPQDPSMAPGDPIPDIDINTENEADAAGVADRPDDKGKAFSFGGTLESAKPTFDIMTSGPSMSTGETQQTIGIRSMGTFLTETNSGKICGLSLCTGSMTMEEKIQLYLDAIRPTN